jgi:outer membrane protein assembly factor BamA
LAGFEINEPLTRGRLFKAQLALYRLGVFSRVSVSLAPGGDESALRDVVIRVVEGDAQRTSYGIGYDSEEGIGGLFGYSHRNLWGQALRFQVDLRASQRSQNYRLLFSRPFWRSGRLPGSQKILLTSLDEDRASFLVEQRGAELELSWDRDRIDYSLFFDLRSSDLTLDDDVVIGDADLPDGQDGRDLQDIDIFSVTPRWRWDRRDDPIDPSRGFLTSMQLEYAIPIDGLATESFRKFFAQGSGYLPLGRAGILALNLRAGVIEPLGNQPVSIAERFFAGGNTTHRAYDRDTLGIYGDTLDSRGNPVGGNGLFLANLDWRFPIVGGIGGTLFYDLGNVWGDWREVRIDEAKGGVGVGLRYLSPVGPLRLDLGWKLDREPEESEYEVFFSLGNAF